MQHLIISLLQKLTHWWLSILFFFFFFFLLKKKKKAQPLTMIPLTLPPRLIGRFTGARDYFHVIVCVPGCVTHQMPNPVVSQCLMPKDPVAGQTGSLNRMRVWLTDKHTEQTVPKPAKKQQPRNKTNKKKNKHPRRWTTIRKASKTEVKFLLVTPPLSCAASDHSW